MQKLVLATQNPGKLIELQQMLVDLDIEVLSALQAGVTDDVVEDGETFEANALKKAREVSAVCGLWCVADDSGICMDALDGAPGVFTARWAGEGASDEVLIDHTLEVMKDKENRRACFRCCAALVSPDGEEWVFDGEVWGKVTTERRGESRPKLPYDSVFVPDEGPEELTFAEMDEALKHTMSHRGRAFAKLQTFLQNRGNA